VVVECAARMPGVILSVVSMVVALEPSLLRQLQVTSSGPVVRKTTAPSSDGNE